MRVAEFMGEDGPAVYSIFGGVLFNLGIPLLIGPFRMVLFRSSYVYGFRMRLEHIGTPNHRDLHKRSQMLQRKAKHHEQLSQEDPNGIGILKSWYHALLRYTKQSQGDDPQQSLTSIHSWWIFLEGKLVISLGISQLMLELPSHLVIQFYCDISHFQVQKCSKPFFAD
jgi:hypothetical protein